MVQYKMFLDTLNGLKVHSKSVVYPIKMYRLYRKMTIYESLVAKQKYIYYIEILPFIVDIQHSY